MTTRDPALMLAVKDTLTKVLNIRATAGELTEESALLGSIPELDSLAVTGVIAGLEERFGFTIEDDEIDAEIFATLGSLVDFTSMKIGSR